MAEFECMDRCAAATQCGVEICLGGVGGDESSWCSGMGLVHGSSLILKSSKVSAIVVVTLLVLVVISRYTLERLFERELRP